MIIIFSTINEDSFVLSFDSNELNQLSMTRLNFGFGITIKSRPITILVNNVFREHFRPELSCFERYQIGFAVSVWQMVSNRSHQRFNAMARDLWSEFFCLVCQLKVHLINQIRRRIQTSSCISQTYRFLQDRQYAGSNQLKKV